MCVRPVDSNTIKLGTHIGVPLPIWNPFIE